MIRYRFELDSRIWARRNVKSYQRDTVVADMRHSDEILAIIKSMLDAWDRPEYFEMPGAYEKLQEVRMRIATAATRTWATNPPWTEAGIRISDSTAEKLRTKGLYSPYAAPTKTHGVLEDSPGAGITKPQPEIKPPPLVTTRPIYHPQHSVRFAEQSALSKTVSIVGSDALSPSDESAIIKGFASLKKSVATGKEGVKFHPRLTKNAEFSAKLSEQKRLEARLEHGLKRRASSVSTGAASTSTRAASISSPRSLRRQRHLRSHSRSSFESFAHKEAERRTSIGRRRSSLRSRGSVSRRSIPGVDGGSVLNASIHHFVEKEPDRVTDAAVNQQSSQTDVEEDIQEPLPTIILPVLETSDETHELVEGSARSAKIDVRSEDLVLQPEGIDIRPAKIITRPEDMGDVTGVVIGNDSPQTVPRLTVQQKDSSGICLVEPTKARNIVVDAQISLKANTGHQQLMVLNSVVRVLVTHQGFGPLLQRAQEWKPQEEVIKTFRELLETYHDNIVEEAAFNHVQQGPALQALREQREDIVQRAMSKRRLSNPCIDKHTSSNHLKDNGVEKMVIEGADNGGRDMELKFLTEGKPFKDLLNGLREFLLPSDLLGELLSIPRHRIVYEGTRELTLLERMQGRFEELTELEWDWWPLPPRMRPLLDGECRVHWQCVSIVSEKVFYGGLTKEVLRHTTLA